MKTILICLLEIESKKNSWVLEDWINCGRFKPFNRQVSDTLAALLNSKYHYYDLCPVDLTF